MKTSTLSTCLLLLTVGLSFGQSSSIDQETLALYLENYAAATIQQFDQAQTEYYAFTDILFEKKPNNVSISRVIKNMETIKIGSFPLRSLFYAPEMNFAREFAGIDDLYQFACEYSIAYARYMSLSRYAFIKDQEVQSLQDNELLAEFDFYNIQDGEIIAEIGFGDASIVELLSNIYPNTIYANEIHDWLTEWLTDRYQAEKQVVVVKGTPQNCGLEAIGLDLVIIRNTVHHFEHMDDMLISISTALNDEGRLIILEDILEEGELHHGPCNKFHRKDFLDLMDQHGFVLQRSLPIYNDGFELFEFKF